MQSKSLNYLIFGVVGLVGLVVLANYLVSVRAVPPLADYMATSTQDIASSTNALASSTLQMIASPSPVVPSRVAASSGQVPLRLPKGTLKVVLATSSEDQEQGLGDRDSLPAGEGMLFVFPTPGSYSFWMKDMRFSLDMVWVGADKRVKGITTNISPATYPATFSPPEYISYVLEVNAGAAHSYGIATGTLLKF